MSGTVFKAVRGDITKLTDVQARGSLRSAGPSTAAGPEKPGLPGPTGSRANT